MSLRMYHIISPIQPGKSDVPVSKPISTKRTVFWWGDVMIVLWDVMPIPAIARSWPSPLQNSSDVYTRIRENIGFLVSLLWAMPTKELTSRETKDLSGERRSQAKQFANAVKTAVECGVSFGEVALGAVLVT